MDFYDVDETNAKLIIKGEINFKYHGKNELYNFSHNIGMYWLGLNTQRKIKLVNLTEIFFSKLNSNELAIIFEKKTPYKNYQIDCFYWNQNNVIVIINNDELVNMVGNIDEYKNKSIIIDTIIFQQIKMSQYDLSNIPSQIKKIKFTYCQIESIDFLHENIEILDCARNSVEQLDNLPRSIKVLLCFNNKLTKLDNLPEGLEILDCHTNNITVLDLLPKSLKYLKCNFNKIESIDNLPTNLISLNCSKNLITSFSKLPEKLVILDITNNKLTGWIDNLPFGLKQLNLSEGIFYSNSNLELIVIECGKYSPNVTIYDLPNMLIDCPGYKFNPKMANLYDRLVNNNYEKFI
jgi:hypothetical protein